MRRYGCEVLDGRVVRVDRTEGGDFRVELTGGHQIGARRVVAATGLIDVLPEIDGLAEHWGRAVIHCPFCHGYEVRDRRVAQIVTHAAGLHPTPLLRQLTDRLTVVVHGAVQVDAAQLDALRVAGVPIVRGRVERVLKGDDGGLVLEVAGHDPIEVDAVVVAPGFTVPVEPFDGLGLLAVPHPNGLGKHIATNEIGETSVSGLYAAGNVTDPSQQVLQAAANGTRVGAMISFSLAEEDLRIAARPSANEADWDHRYGDRRIWSGNPNGTLVHEARDLPPGRALDVGTGEGADAMWLAERGWRVTANDISRRALDRVAGETARRGLAIECLHADANGLDPFGGATFDLVSAQYASIPRTPDGRAARNLLDAVAPGGTLLVVSHDLDPMRAPIDTHTASRAFDPDAYVRVEDLVATIAGSAEWDVEVHERRPRPPGAASSHHVDDIVMRARRRDL